MRALKLAWLCQHHARRCFAYGEQYRKVGTFCGILWNVASPHELHVQPSERLQWSLSCPQYAFFIRWPEKSWGKSATTRKKQQTRSCQRCARNCLTETRWSCVKALLAQHLLALRCLPSKLGQDSIQLFFGSRSCVVCHWTDSLGCFDGCGVVLLQERFSVLHFSCFFFLVIKRIADILEAGPGCIRLHSIQCSFCHLPLTHH